MAPHYVGMGNSGAAPYGAYRFVDHQRSAGRSQFVAARQSTRIWRKIGVGSSGNAG